jgi:hypothetical protein
MDNGGLAGLAMNIPCYRPLHPHHGPFKPPQCLTKCVLFLQEGIPAGIPSGKLT